LLRTCWVLASVNVALVANSVFHLWTNEAMLNAWMKFVDTPWLSAKKALYIELAIQLVLYFFLVVTQVDWSGLLIVLAAIYLGGGQKSFLAMYMIFVVISILFDTIYALALPSFSAMTDGEAWGASLWVAIFCLKFVIVGTIIAYEKLEADHLTKEAQQMTSIAMGGSAAAAAPPARGAIGGAGAGRAGGGMGGIGGGGMPQSAVTSEYSVDGPGRAGRAGARAGIGGGGQRLELGRVDNMAYGQLHDDPTA
jgi:hypothetical protein